MGNPAKKKTRDKLVKAKVQKRREFIRSERKKDEVQKIKEHAMHELMHGKPKPFVKNRESKPVDSKVINEKLENNLKILEALEEEYDQEQALRAEMNEKLEAEGCSTIKEKMDALHKKALDITGKTEALAQAAEEYSSEENIIDLQPIIK